MEEKHRRDLPKPYYVKSLLKQSSIPETDTITSLHNSGQEFAYQRLPDLNLRYARLVSSNLLRVYLKRSDLRNVCFGNSNLTSTKLQNTNMLGVRLGEPSVACKSAINCMSIGCESEVVAGTASSCIVNWNYNTRLQSEMPAHSKAVTAIAHSSQGFVSASADCMGKIWGKENIELKGHTYPVTSLAVSCNDVIATGSRDTTIKVWDIDGNLLTTLNGQSVAIRDLDFSSDGQFLASAVEDKRIGIWNMQDYKINLINGADDYFTAIQFSPDRRQVCTDSISSSIKLWDIEAGNCDSFDGHSRRVTSLAYSPNSQYIVSGSIDCSIRLWDLRTSKSILIGTHESAVTSVKFTADGYSVVSGSLDSTIKLRELNIL